MPLDPNIILANADPARQYDPVAAMQKAQSLKAAMMQGQIQQQQLQDAADFKAQTGVTPGMAKHQQELATAQWRQQEARTAALNEKAKAEDWLADRQRRAFDWADKAVEANPEAAPQIHAQTLKMLADNAQKIGVDTSKSDDPISFTTSAAPFAPGQQDAPQVWDLNAHKTWLKDKAASVTPEAVANKRAELALAQQKADAEQWEKVPVQGGFAMYNEKTGEWRDAPSKYKPPIPASVQIHNMPPQSAQGVPDAVQKGATGQDALAAMPPNVQNVVKAIIDGRQTAPGGMAQKTPYWQGIMQNVYAVDPQWSEQRAQIRKAFTTGKDGTNIGSLNTATVHLDDYMEAAKAIKNGTFKPGNALYNKVSDLMGQPAPTDLATFSNIVAGEMANALKGTATDIEIHNIKQTMENSSSPDQFIANGKSSMKAMWQKLGTYKERYAQQIPGDTTWNPVLPSANAVFGKYGFGGQAPSGQGEGKGLTSAQLPKLSVEEAAKLKPGERFLDMNGKERVKK